MQDADKPALRSPTDQSDLESALHTIGNSIPDEAADEIMDEPEGEESSSDLPQEYTESYGTGVAEMPGYSMGGRTMRDRQQQYHEATPDLTGGDIDANYEQANAEGDESVGGTVATPDMDIVDDLGKAVGLEMDDRAFLMTNEILEGRDSHRWELEPKSSEDYNDRRQDDEITEIPMVDEESEPEDIL
ncbi:MAG: hypothetical protein KME16_19870 [Scytolyngbya sp. HA4215-MV1]|jgi:hypothetical protein|nr:hypothetical protein [Scytolyngbya sp. HA4215-MV1]